MFILIIIGLLFCPRVTIGVLLLEAGYPLIGLIVILYGLFYEK
jgi:hypothetical protein